MNPIRRAVNRNGGHWKGLDDLELAISKWVHWFNEERIHTEFGDLTLAEFEVNYDVENQAPRHDGVKRKSLH